MRAQAATVAATSAGSTWETEAASHRKLDLVELHGYFRVRPELLHKLDLDQPPDAGGYWLFPRPDGHSPCSHGLSGGHSIAGTNMRFRLDPTLNISEEVRIRVADRRAGQPGVGKHAPVRLRPPGQGGHRHPRLEPDPAHRRRQLDPEQPRGEAGLGRGGHADWPLEVRPDGRPVRPRHRPQRRQLPRLRLRRHGGSLPVRGRAAARLLHRAHHRLRPGGPGERARRLSGPAVRRHQRRRLAHLRHHPREEGHRAEGAGEDRCRRHRLQLRPVLPVPEPELRVQRRTATRRASPSRTRTRSRRPR